MDASFVDPPWDAPLDHVAELKRIPDGRTQKGMFLLAMVLEAKRRGIALKSARARYVPFNDYPLREHATLLTEAASAFFPDLSMRQGLRRLGRAAYPAFMESTVGKVVWANVSDLQGALESFMKGYSIGVPGCVAKVLERRPNGAVIRLERLPYFLDCHHVGCLEGATRAVGPIAKVKIHLYSHDSADFLCEW